MESDLVYDVGMYKGEDSEFYLKKGFRVVAIEAVSAFAEGAAERLENYIRAGRLIILNVAVANRDGPVTFWENTALNTLCTADLAFSKASDPKRRRSIEKTVRGRSFEGILREFGVPYYLKVDIEGSDLLCLKALKQFESRPRHVSIESTKRSWKNLLEEFAVFKDLGYSKFKVVAQDSWRGQKCPFPAREGQFIDYQFADISSGLFGEEAPGTWLNENEAIKTYRRIFWRYRVSDVLGYFRLGRFIEPPKWFDTHAT